MQTVRIGAPVLMRTDPELALYGRYVVSRRLREMNFEFRVPKLRAALERSVSRLEITFPGLKFGVDNFHDRC